MLGGWGNAENGGCLFGRAKMGVYFFFWTVAELNTWEDKQSTAKSRGALWPWSTCLLWGEGHSVIPTSKKVRVKSKESVADFKRITWDQCSFSLWNSAAITINPPIIQTNKHPSHIFARYICHLCVSQPYLHKSKSAKSALGFSLHHISKALCACSEDPSWFAKAPNLLSILLKPSRMHKLVPLFSLRTPSPVTNIWF